MLKSWQLELFKFCDPCTSQKLDCLLAFNLIVRLGLFSHCWLFSSCSTTLIFLLSRSAFVLYYKLHELFVSKPAERTHLHLHLSLGAKLAHRASRGKNSVLMKYVFLCVWVRCEIKFREIILLMLVVVNLVSLRSVFPWLQDYLPLNTKKPRYHSSLLLTVRRSERAVTGME